jgi:hypothetical protein
MKQLAFHFLFSLVWMGRQSMLALPSFWLAGREGGGGHGEFFFRQAAKRRGQGLAAIRGAIIVENWP